MKKFSFLISIILKKNFKIIFTQTDYKNLKKSIMSLLIKQLKINMEIWKHKIKIVNGKKQAIN